MRPMECGSGEGGGGEKKRRRRSQHRLQRGRGNRKSVTAGGTNEDEAKKYSSQAVAAWCLLNFLIGRFPRARATKTPSKARASITRHLCVIRTREYVTCSRCPRIHVRIFCINHTHKAGRTRVVRSRADVAPNP